MTTLKMNPTRTIRDRTALAVLIAGTVGLMVTMGALNGGAAPTASVWDGLVTYLSGLLTSTWVLVLAFIALIAAVWQLAHGRGYGGVGLILGILAIALLGPGLVNSVATSTRPAPTAPTASTGLQAPGPMTEVPALALTASAIAVSRTAA